MIVVVRVVLAVAALATWVVAVSAAIGVVRASNPGQRISNYFLLGLWRFSVLEARIGPSAGPLTRRYRNALLAFLGIILLMMLTGGLLAIEQQN